MTYFTFVGNHTLNLHIMEAVVEQHTSGNTQSNLYQQAINGFIVGYGIDWCVCSRGFCMSYLSWGDVCLDSDSIRL